MGEIEKCEVKNMTNTINLSVDVKTNEKLNELSDLINTSRSEVVRKMIKYFYKNQKLLEEI